MKHTESIMPAVIACVVMTGFYGGLAYVMYNVFSATTPPDPKAFSILDMYVVASISALSGAIGYWIGTTHSSKAKDELLYNSTPSDGQNDTTKP